MVTSFVIIGALIKVLVDTIKRRFPDLSVEGIQLVAVSLGIAAAALTGMDVAGEVVETAGDWPEWLRVGISGIALGLGSSFVHDMVKAVGTAKT